MEASSSGAPRSVGIEGDVLVVRPASRSRVGRFGPLGPQLIPGLLLTLVVTAMAEVGGFVETRIVGHAVLEPLVLALLLGIVGANTLRTPARALAGIRFSSGTLLSVAIVLLGASVDLTQIASAGTKLMTLVVLVVCLGTAGSFLIGKLLGLSDRMAILVAVGNSICGNSAIAATAPAVGATREEVASSISLTAIVGVVQVLLLPIAATLMKMGDYRYGVLAGLTVYSIPQVVAASLEVSPLSGSVAVLTKLTRVVLLGPMVFTLAVISSRRDGGAKNAPRFAAWKSYLPGFLVGFALCAVLRTGGLVPDLVSARAKDSSSFLFVISMAAIGLEVHMRSIGRSVPRVSLAVCTSILLLTTGAVIGIWLFAIG